MTCKLEEIFKRQAEFVQSLRPIYLHNGFTRHASAMPWPINVRQSQEEFRLLAWRCTEEVYEAIQVLRVKFGRTCDTDETLSTSPEFVEEVADALHFFVELCLAIGMNSREVIHYYEGRPISVGYNDALDHVFRFTGKRLEDQVIDRWNLFVERLARAMMLLKQRPWRTDDRFTDANRLKGAMAASFIAFIAACKRSGITADSLHEAYFAKSKINDQRAADQKL